MAHHSTGQDATEHILITVRVLRDKTSVLWRYGTIPERYCIIPENCHIRTDWVADIIDFDVITDNYHPSVSNNSCIETCMISLQVLGIAPQRNSFKIIIRLYYNQERMDAQGGGYGWCGIRILQYFRIKEISGIRNPG